MDTASVRASLGKRVRRAGLLAWLAVLPTGCAWWNNRPAEPARLGEIGPGAADPYLARSRPNEPTGPAPTLVRSTIHPGTDPVRTPTSDDRPAVILGAPISAATPPRSVSTPAPAADPLATARVVVAEARAKVDAMANYQVHMNRQERVGGQLLPTEDVLLSIRREPRAVRLEWPTGPSRGREVIFASDDPRGMLHVHMGNPLVPAVSMKPDSPLVMRNSRHPITEAGFGTIIDNLQKGLDGDTPGASIAYRGIDSPTAVGRPCHQIVRRTPNGDFWMVFLDVATGLPAMVAETSASGELLERYIFRDVQPNVPGLAQADAFDPERRWSGGGGLLGRLTRTVAPDAKTAVNPPQP